MAEGGDLTPAASVAVRVITLWSRLSQEFSMSTGRKGFITKPLLKCHSLLFNLLKLKIFHVSGTVSLTDHSAS